MMFRKTGDSIFLFSVWVIQPALYLVTLFHNMLLALFSGRYQARFPGLAMFPPAEGSGIPGTEGAMFKVPGRGSGHWEFGCEFGILS